MVCRAMRQGPGMGAQRPDPLVFRFLDVAPLGLLHGGSQSSLDTGRPSLLGRAVACSMSGFAAVEAELVLHTVLALLRSQRLVFAIGRSIEVHGSATRIRADLYLRLWGVCVGARLAVIRGRRRLVGLTTGILLAFEDTVVQANA